MDGRGRVPRRDAGRLGSRARGRAFLERRCGTAGDQRHAESRQTAAPARTRPRSPCDPGDRHARRLQHDLARSGAAGRRPPDHARGREKARGRRAGQSRARGRVRPRRSARRTCAGEPAPARIRGTRPFRLSSSSTPTKRTRPNTSAGRSSSHGRAASSSSTTSCAAGRSSTNAATMSGWWRCGGFTRCCPGRSGLRPRSSRRSAEKGTTASLSRWS